MRTLTLCLFTLVSVSLAAQKPKDKKNTDAKAKVEATPVKAEATPVKAEDPSMPRVRELSKIFFDFIEVIHGPDVEKARKFLADGVQTAVNHDNLVALSKSIRSDLKMVTLSTAVEKDTGRSEWELIQFQYENGPEPVEVFQIVFDKTNK